jgi:hypothetical protein
MDIFIKKDGFRTLTNIVIVDSTYTNLVQHASTMIVHATIVVVQNKAQSYIKQMLIDDFIPLAIKTYCCLHPHFDSFFISYVHANIICHHQTSLVPLMFIFYCKQQVS